MIVFSYFSYTLIKKTEICPENFVRSLISFDFFTLPPYLTSMDLLVWSYLKFDNEDLYSPQTIIKSSLRGPSYVSLGVSRFWFWVPFLPKLNKNSFNLNCACMIFLNFNWILVGTQGSSGKQKTLPRSFFATPSSLPPSFPPSAGMKFVSEVTGSGQKRPYLSAPKKREQSWFTFPGTKIFHFVLSPQLELSLRRVEIHEFN
jgi:hypothetical protein